MSQPHTVPKQRGVVLAIALLWLLVATLLLVSSAQNALHEQKAARAFRDRAVAFQAAEAGLVDAESDIDASPSPALSRSAMFAADRTDGFPQENQALCRQGGADRSQGLCRQAQGDALLSLLADDVANALTNEQAGSGTVAVEYGRFTGRTLQTGGGALPARLPRYVIELMRDHTTGADAVRYLYRITAIGFGPQPEIQVVLQSFYRKALTS